MSSDWLELEYWNIFFGYLFGETLCLLEHFKLYFYNHGPKIVFFIHYFGPDNNTLDNSRDIQM